MVRQWSTKASAAARKLKSYKERLAEAERIANNPNFEHYKNVVNEVT